MPLLVPRAKLHECEGDNRMALQRGACAGVGGKGMIDNLMVWKTVNV